MSDSRARILQRLCRKAAAALNSPHPYRPVLDWSHEERIAHFGQMLEAVHGRVVRVAKDDWPAHLNTLLEEYGVRRLLIGPDIWPGSAIADQPPEGIELMTYAAPVETWKQTLFHEIDAAVTGALGAIAQTGSLVLWPSTAEPRLMSLVPPLHLVVLHAEQLFDSFAELIQAQQWADSMPTNALLISGPSKSADIEQVLAYGVHGPKDLVVLLCE